MRPTTRKLVANLIPAVVVPVTRVGTEYVIERRILRERQEFELKKVEKRAEAMSSLTGEPVEDRTPKIDSQPRSPRVYEGLERLRRESDCGFCASAADELLQQDRETAAQGLAELQQYQDYLGEASTEGIPPEQIESDVESIVGGWETVPRVVAGAAPA